MLLLAFDTATPVTTVAVHDGERVRAEVSVLDARRHGELLAPQVRETLAAAGASLTEVTEVAVGVGPGPYTGLRVGVVTARVFGLSLGVPVHGVCTLDALAAQAVAEVDGLARFVVATDARRREVYWAAYDETGRRVDGPQVCAPADVPLDGRPVVGRGAALYADVLGPTGGPVVGPTDPSAGWLAAYAVGELSAGRRLLPPEPLYLRRPDATAPGPSKRVLV